jgi:sporulation protein YlmC with PRC-barrel domain
VALAILSPAFQRQRHKAAPQNWIANCSPHFPGAEIMPVNRFEDSRIASGTLRPGAHEIGETAVTAPPESAAISRDDIRDGAASAPNRRVISVSSLTGKHVRNTAGEDLGAIEEIMLDIPSGRAAYAVLLCGGFLGLGAKLLAVPWSSFRIEEGEAGPRPMLDVDRKTLENAPAFDKDKWPDLADSATGREIHEHYGQTPWWVHDVTDAGDYMGDNVQRNRSVEYEPASGYRAGGGH